MLPPSGLLCNRPDKEQWLLISAAQRLRTSRLGPLIPRVVKLTYNGLLVGLPGTDGL